MHSGLTIQSAKPAWRPENGSENEPGRRKSKIRRHLCGNADLSVRKNDASDMPVLKMGTDVRKDKNYISYHSKSRSFFKKIFRIFQCK